MSRKIRLPRVKRYRRAKPYQVIDQKVLAIGDSLWLSQANDLFALTGAPANTIFDTAMLAGWLERPRWFAQQVAYVLHRCGASVEAGKRGNNRLYQGSGGRPKKATTARTRATRSAA